MVQEQPVGARIEGALRDLDVGRVHVAFASNPADAVNFVTRRPEVVASLTAVLPFSPPSDLPGDWPILAIFGNESSGRVAAARLAPAWDRASIVELPSDYEAAIWADPLADHTELITSAMRSLMESAPLPPASIMAGETESNGIRVRVEGAGPPVVLLPGGLFPTQWASAAKALAPDFTVIRLSGPHLGALAVLEDRAATAGYSKMVDGLFTELEVERATALLEVGTGSGPLVRQLSQRTAPEATIYGIDLSPFQIDEAAAIARLTGHDNGIDFRVGNAEQLPFDDNSLDVVFAVTVLEECDADRAIAEMHRVLRPGGRAGVIVRAIDLPGHLNVDVPTELQAKLNEQMQLVGPRGCADRSLYQRFAAHFPRSHPYAHLWTSSPPLPSLVEARRASLNEKDRSLFLEALERGNRAGTAFLSNPVHCVVGVK